MRILFSGNALAGHILPMMPLADAARAAGHETALLASGSIASLVAPLRVLPAGPPLADMFEETVARTGADLSQAGPGPVELFAGVRVELSIDEALRQAEAFDPELIVCEQLDFVGPLVAASRGVPWVAHAISSALPEPLWDAFQARLAPHYERRSLARTPRIALVDPYPEALRSSADRPVEDRISIRPGVNEHGAARSAQPLDDYERPCALVTVGTMVDDSTALSALASSVAAAGFTAIVTAEADALSPDIDRRRVRPVGFVPLAQLLPRVDLVVTAGGTGTVLAALSHGLPMVIRPFVADQPWNATRISEMGAGIAIDDVTEAGAAALRIAENPKYREAAREASTGLALMNSPASALHQLITLDALSMR
jgi:UDP:flavonoid glycosyltransferase YjiC (YdhE family)